MLAFIGVWLYSDDHFLPVSYKEYIVNHLRDPTIF